MGRCESTNVTDDLIRRVVVCDEKLTLSTKLYRYIPIQRYLQMIEYGYNALAHISYWEDPYEAFIFRGGLKSYVVRHPDMEDRIYDAFRYVYGQSWTKDGDEKDVIWRAMSTGSRGTLVRIQTSVRKLAESILKSLNRDGLEGGISDRIRIARIKYMNREELDARLLEENLRDVLNSHARMGFFFVKREEFSLEDEVRVIVIPKDEEIDRVRCKDGGLLKFSISPAKLIEEVLVDPCVTQREYEMIKCRTRFVSTQIDVVKSGLFEWPEMQEDLEAGPVLNHVPCEEAVRNHLLNDEGKRPDNVDSIVKRVLRVLKAVRFVGNDAPSFERLLEILRCIGDVIDNASSAYDCKVAIRAYMRALYNRDDRQ